MDPMTNIQYPDHKTITAGLPSSFLADHDTSSKNRLPFASPLSDAPLLNPLDLEVAFEEKSGIST